MSLEFKVGHAASSDILAHLRDCDASFNPVLSNRVNLVDYSEKLSHQAVTFEAWQGARLVGLIAAYFNNLEAREGFISTVSTLPELTGRGSASTLMDMVLRYAGELGFTALSLEVGESNLPALNLYRKWGFEGVGTTNGMVRMRCTQFGRQS